MSEIFRCFKSILANSDKNAKEKKLSNFATISSLSRTRNEKVEIKLHKLNNRRQGHYLDPVLIVDFSRLLTTPANNNVVQHLTSAVSWQDGTALGRTHLTFVCFVAFLSPYRGDLKSLFLSLPPSLTSFSWLTKTSRTNTHQRFLSCGSLINDRLSGK